MMIKALKMAGIKQFINKYIDGIGQIRDMDIDRTNKRIELIIELEGETILVKVVADGYQLDREGLTFHNFKCDKAWIENVLNKYLVGRTIDVPDGLAYTAINAVL